MNFFNYCYLVKHCANDDSDNGIVQNGDFDDNHDQFL